MGEEPLIRAELVTTPAKKYLLVDIHHMVTDGTSYLVLFPQSDLPLAYEGKPLTFLGTSLKYLEVTHNLSA